jgi:murein DD-endopeptidase MepM/ murein hydrolase activator NlpD
MHPTPRTLTTALLATALFTTATAIANPNHTNPDSTAHTAPAAPAPPADDRAWPVPRTTGTSPPILRGWDPPATPYGPGHRGIDLAAPPGTPVRAAAPGRIAHTGRIANRGVLTIDHPNTGDPPLRTTYEPVHALVDKGDRVAAGDIIGTLENGPPHCTRPCLHWGLRRAKTYLNPLTLLPPPLLHHGPSRLLPVWGEVGVG